MMKTRGAIAAIATMALVAALGNSAVAAAEADVPGLTGIEWSLDSITTDGTAIDVPGDVSATLSMEDGGARGSGGCNSWFGDYRVDGSALSFGLIGSTQMFCEGPGQVVEDAYLAALGTVAYWSITDAGTLSLQDEARAEVLAFSVGKTSIEGVTWLLRWQAVGDTQAATPDGVLVSLRLLDGQAGGSGGCNRYSTTYAIDGGDLMFGRVASTLMACAQPAGTVESDYLANLAAVRTWSSDGATLTLGSADGFDLLQYEAAPEASVVGSWTAVGINNGADALVSSATTSAITADFSATGDLTGFDGCNDYFTTYEVDGDSIVISDAIGSTMMACASDELAAQSQGYFAALAAASSWSSDDGGNLQLRDDAGALQVDYMPTAG